VLGNTLGDNVTLLLLSLAMVCILELLKLQGQSLIFHYPEEIKLLLRKTESQ